MLRLLNDAAMSSAAGTRLSVARGIALAMLFKEFVTLLTYNSPIHIQAAVTMPRTASMTELSVAVLAKRGRVPQHAPTYVVAHPVALLCLHLGGGGPPFLLRQGFSPLLWFGGWVTAVRDTAKGHRKQRRGQRTRHNIQKKIKVCCRGLDKQALSPEIRAGTHQPVVAALYLCTYTTQLQQPAVAPRPRGLQPGERPSAIFC
jgi:hypothetical protein